MTTLSIPGTLPSLNEYIDECRRCKYAGAKMKKDATELVAWCAKGLPPAVGPVIVQCRFYVPNRRKDPDNVVAGATKFLLDGLVEGGVLPNDTMKWIGGLEFTWEVDEENPRIEVTLKGA